MSSYTAHFTLVYGALLILTTNAAPVPSPQQQELTPDEELEIVQQDSSTEGKKITGPIIAVVVIFSLLILSIIAFGFRKYIKRQKAGPIARTHETVNVYGNLGDPASPPPTYTNYGENEPNTPKKVDYVNPFDAEISKLIHDDDKDVDEKDLEDGKSESVYCDAVSVLETDVDVAHATLQKVESKEQFFSASRQPRLLPPVPEEPSSLRAPEATTDRLSIHSFGKRFSVTSIVKRFGPATGPSPLSQESHRESRRESRGFFQSNPYQSLS